MTITTMKHRAVSRCVLLTAMMLLALPLSAQTIEWDLQGAVTHYEETVIEDVLGHPESYGDDLNRIIDEKYFGESLKDPAKVAEAIMHKGTSRFDYADKLWAQAQATDGMLKRELLQAQAVNETMEGCRQIKKVFDLLLARDQYRNLPPKISDELKEAVGLLRPLNGVDYKLSQVEMALAEKGYTFRSLNKAVSEAVKVVV